MSDELVINQENNTTQSNSSNKEELRKQRRMIIIGICIAILILSIIGFAVWGLLQPSTDTTKIRDIFIIFMAVESFIIGLTLIILMIQLARLLNLLQNEIKPIINSTNETVNTLKGTSIFLSNNLVEPVMKLNEYLAGFQQMLKLVGIGKKSKL
ncbi:MAG: hypothetical protein GYA34_07885 [Chloroflexi bacterium]|nr:hypothetical protein [Chloroflexota bacterium]